MMQISGQQDLAKCEASEAMPSRFKPTASHFNRIFVGNSAANERLLLHKEHRTTYLYVTTTSIHCMIGTGEIESIMSKPKCMNAGTGTDVIDLLQLETKKEYS